VFDLKWHDFEYKKAYDAKEGYFEARVRPDFRTIMEGDIYRVNVIVSRQLYHMADIDADKMVEQQVDQAYSKIVREMQHLIRASRPKEILHGKGIPAFASNSHTTVRDPLTD